MANTTTIGKVQLTSIGHGLKGGQYHHHLITLCGTRGAWAWSVMHLDTEGYYHTDAKGEATSVIAAVVAACAWVDGAK